MISFDIINSILNIVSGSNFDNSIMMFILSCSKISPDEIIVDRFIAMEVIFSNKYFDLNIIFFKNLFRFELFCFNYAVHTELFKIIVKGCENFRNMILLYKEF